MSARQLLVTVVIPTHQRRELLRRALRALTSQELPADSFEVVVSIDRSIDGTREMAELFDAPYALRTMEAPRRGRAAACNAAIDAARGEVLVILDDDMEPRPALLSSHYRSHPPGSRLCVMGAAPISTDGSSASVTRYAAAKFNAHLARLARSDHVLGIRDFYSGNASIRREVLLETGMYDESFRLYGNEDLELCLRLRKAGVEIRFDSSAVAEQQYTKSLAELAQDTFEKGRTAVSFVSAHPEVFDGLQLATYGAASLRWSGVRSALLAATRKRPGARAQLVRLAQGMERMRAMQRPLFYRFVLDYCYWAGVDEALSESPANGRLTLLAAELERGPISLLLHR
jgi:GT2 family glycosyltransferase